jgi:Carboxypeptidase regulatory-like domain
MTLRVVRLMALCAAVLALAAPSAAQVYTGRIDVTVTDTTGAILPNVTVTLRGPQDATAVTDDRGEAHFVSLAPGVYIVTATLSGFADYTNRNVPVVTGGVVPLKATLAVGGVNTQVDVMAATPTIDPKKLATSTNVTVEQLQNIPSSRDPWVVLQTVPGIIVDRVNVGGAESGQQSAYQAKGAPTGDNTWNMDGVAITDMSALGSSPTYYDFDMFQEMNVTTGGADLTNATPGVALNFVLKGGSNTPHGSTRIYYENEDMQSSNLPDDLKAALGGTTGKGNRIKEYQDYGFELGGPVVKDRLWAWGALGKTDVTLLTLTDTTDQTILKNQAFKINGLATPNIRGSYTYFNGDKQKFGRNASPTRPPETTWNQKGPSPVHKVEGNFVLGNNFFMTGRWSYVGGGFQLTPQGGLDAPYYWDDAGIARGSYYHYDTVRPAYAATAEGNYFRGRHEIRFGFGWRKADVDSTSIVPGPNRIVTYHDGYPNMTAEVTVWNDNTSATGKYSHAYVGDTMSFDRLTLTAGVRWDRQTGSVAGRTQAGNPVLPQYLPDLTSQSQDDVIVWNSVVPRLGVSYGLDEQRKTLLRASYGMFASQLNATAGNFLSTVGFRGVYFYNVTDLNGNRVADPAEIAGRTCSNALVSDGECEYYGFTIADPASVGQSIHRVGAYQTPLTHEVQFGFDRELMTNFALNATFTWRRFTNFTWRNNGLVGTDYERIGSYAGTHPAIGGFDVPISGAIESRIPEDRAATTYRARDGYSQRYLGFEVSATKQLSDRWMARFGFSTNDHREYFDSLAAMTDPTPQVIYTTGRLTAVFANTDGGLVPTVSTGSGKGGIIQLLPKYQFIATGMYQGPWGINVAGNFLTRQGFSMTFHEQSVPTLGDPNAARKHLLLVGDVDRFRLPAVSSLDARLGKEFAFDRYRINLDLDIFNVFNTNTVLARQYNLGVTSGNSVLEIMNPRVLRLGARFNF